MISKMASAGYSKIILCAFKVTVFALVILQVFSDRSFTIDYEKETFMKDGKPFRYVSGSIHYARVPRYYWKDPLTKMYAAGLNAIQTYVPWNFHETTPGHYNFEGDHDLIAFLKTAQEVGLLVILRGGPYICGEWEFGGFPGWLLKHNSSMVLRTMDPGYLAPVGRWLSVLLPLIRPMLYSNGGPIILLQPENEYGSWYACDHEYMRYLYDTFRLYVNDEVVIFTTDGCLVSNFKCGPVKGAYASVDFGPSPSNTKNCFKIQMDYNRGPKINSEYYTGWLDLWGLKHSVSSSNNVAHYLDDILGYDSNTNVNMYMFEGGTNFGYWNGAEMRPFDPQVTSYDYDSPLSEAGDLTNKYHAIRKVIGKYWKLPNVPIPKNTTKYAYGKVQMEFVSTVLDNLPQLSPENPINSQYPLTMEQIDHYYGFVLYRHVFYENHYDALLNISGIRDRGYVSLNNVPIGSVIREHNVTIPRVSTRLGDVLDIIVENQGRIGFAIEMLGEIKGIISNVTMNNAVLSNWEIYPLHINNTRMVKDGNLRFRPGFQSSETLIHTPSLFVGSIPPAHTGKNYDTYLRMGPSWTKGQVFINGFNVGRYWPVKGPQITLYVPANIINPSPKPNTILILELEQAPCSMSSKLPSCYLEFIDYPILAKAGRVSTHRYLRDRSQH